MEAIAMDAVEVVETIKVVANIMYRIFVTKKEFQEELKFLMIIEHQKKFNVTIVKSMDIMHQNAGRKLYNKGIK